MDARQMDAQHMDAQHMGAQHMDAQQMDAHQMDAHQMDAHQKDTSPSQQSSIETAASQITPITHTTITVEIVEPSYNYGHHHTRHPKPYHTRRPEISQRRTSQLDDSDIDTGGHKKERSVRHMYGFSEGGCFDSSKGGVQEGAQKHEQKHEQNHGH